MLTFGPRVGGFRKEKRAGLSNGEFSVEKKIRSKNRLKIYKRLQKIAHTKKQ